MTEQTSTTTPRPLHAIAAEIRQTWPNVYFGATPYLDAMGALTTMADSFILDSAQSIISYFLANASGWRGADARRIKAELKAMAGIK